MTSIETSRLVLRPCREEDHDLFFELSSDSEVLEFFPFRRSREDADAIFTMIRDMTPEPGFDLLVMTLKESGEAIGLCGLSKPKLEPYLPAETVEIGWRIAARHWGKGYATEAGIALLHYAFNTLKLNEMVGIAVESNLAVLAVMRNIGMKSDPACDFDHPQIPDTHPHLKRHTVYRLSAAEWHALQAGQAPR
ncbi:GNAT family N-acetyltransferase [Rhizobium lusitanum]|uniref:RimJ/RimL family protein N-acetyltransferase n=1 Tax=Rhizobium lusitanum TaxID=293958 RepID=A0A7X0IS60_9HYPH|nr:GNAT family N-acetyltransferase [Rhizobium lusitanum]MBB6485012.1 RimJ/RimL family protein N-acetyltransferase [Rhizobium lusitanum]